MLTLALLGLFVVLTLGAGYLGLIPRRRSPDPAADATVIDYAGRGRHWAPGIEHTTEIQLDDLKARLAADADAISEVAP